MSADSAAAPRVLGVVGVGLIGGSILRGVRAAFPGTRLVGVTLTEEDAVEVRQAGLCDESSVDAAVLRGADVVVLATPVDATVEWLGRVQGVDGLVTDTGSTKALVAARGRALLGERFLGGHPMAGREASGHRAADPALFRGATWVVTPAADDPTWAERFAPWLRVVTALGAVPLALDPGEHDRAVALASHLPLALSAALVSAAAAEPQWELAGRLAAGGFRDTARLAGGDARMAAAIALTNREPLLRALDAAAGELATLRTLVDAGDAAGLRTWFASARDARSAWLQRGRG